MNGKINEKMGKRQGREVEEIGLTYFSYYLFLFFFSFPFFIERSLEI
jgi:hypothetical protein